MLKKIVFVFVLFIASVSFAKARVYTLEELAMHDGLIYDNMGELVNGVILLEQMPEYNFSIPYEKGKVSDDVVSVTDKQGNVVSKMNIKDRLVVSGFNVRDGQEYPIEGSDLNVATVAVQQIISIISGILDPSTLQNGDTQYPLYQAADRGDLSEVKRLVKAGVKVNYVCNNPCQGWTPVMIAAANGHDQVVHYLLEAGANPNIQNRFGRTPLHYVAKYNFWYIAKDLLEHGADPNIESKNDVANTPVKAALAAENTDMLRLLLKYGGDKNVTVNGVSIMDLANKKNAVELKKLLK